MSKATLQVTNDEIARNLKEMADLLEIKGADFFRIRAYRQAVDAIAEIQESLSEMVQQGKDLAELKGIGDAIALKIADLVTTGKIHQLEDLKKEYPPELITLTRVENLGPKRVGKLFRELKVVTIDDLKKVVSNGKLDALEGFGPKLVSEISKDLERANFEETRIQWAEAEALAQPLLEFLKNIKGVKQVEIAGSYRRKKETVGDFDLLATAKDGVAVITAFLEYPSIKKAMAEGPTRATVILETGMQVDLRVVPDDSFGAALQYFTGSKTHNIGTRKLALEKGLKLNEYGMYKGDKKVAGATEEEIYKILDLEWVTPELREDRGELEAAAKHTLPTLLELKDIKGDFQFHTDHSDGTATLEEMAAAAQAQGLEYVVVTDHSKFVGITHGQDEAQLAKQIKEVAALNKKLKNFTVLAGVEVDILADGALALPDSILEKLDVVIAAIHTNFKLDREHQTKRLIAAINNPNVDMIAHPTGRILNQRSGYEIDLERVVAAAKEKKVALEINAHPSRLDLDDKAAKYVKDQGVKLVLSTDSHATDGFALMRFGINQARRAWLEKDDVLNTLSLQKLLDYIRLR